MVADNFYWRTARDSLLTEAALQLYQLLATQDGQLFEDVKDKIDSDYSTARGRGATERHGGNIQTAVQVFREAGWVELPDNGAGKHQIKITPAGTQALLLLTKAPDFLKAVPDFITNLLVRYQLNNPARPESRRDENYEAQLAECNVFPYWTLFKVIRECDSYITSDELRRFVFRLHRTEDIPNAISQIHSFRTDKQAGFTDEQINAKYPAEIEIASDNQKYLMTRLGVHVGKNPPVIEKEGASKWVLNKNYLPLVDEILANEPIFKEHLTETTWIQDYGKLVPIAVEQRSSQVDTDEPETLDLIDEVEPIWLEVSKLVDSGVRTLLLIGPPGTSKTWYARKIAARLADGDSKRVKFVQFHPSYNYEDFVEGYVPGADKSGPLFVPVPKVFLKMCERAKENSQLMHVLVIDEFNRGDPSRVFGELLTYLERDYRGKRFSLPYSGKPFYIPENVLILGTMNPFDKSVTDLDDAMERRFERIPLEPDAKILSALLTSAGMSNESIGKVVEFFNFANRRCRHGMGHAFFSRIADEYGLIKLWNYKLRYVLEKQFRFEPDTLKELREAYGSVVADQSKLL